VTPPRERKSAGGAAPAKAPLIQDRPAAKAAPKAPVLDPDNRDEEFPPNPIPSAREGRPAPRRLRLRVIGPKEVGGVLAPGWLGIDLTDSQLDALLAGGHVEDWDGVEGWGSDDTSDAESEAGVPAADIKTEPKDQPTAGTDKEGS